LFRLKGLTFLSIVVKVKVKVKVVNLYSASSWTHL